MRFVRAACCLAFAAAAGACVHAPGGRLASEWRLVGPFDRQRTGQPTSMPAAPPAPDRPEIQVEPLPTSQPAPRGEPASPLTTQPAPLTTHAAQPPVSSNGLFSLRDEHEVRSGIGRTPEGETAPEAEAVTHHLFAPKGEIDESFWYLDLGFRTGVTKLGTAKQQLDRRLDLPLKLDVFGIFEHPQTPIDRKSDMALTTGYIGVGRRETEWLTWNFYFGSGVGTDRDHQRWLNANLDVNFKYALYYTGLTVDLYPWGLSQRGRFASFVEHLKASRPYVVTGMEFGYLKAKGWGHFALAPVTLYADEQVNEDWLVSYLAGLGWEVPIDDRWALNLQAHYTFHLYRPEEYDGWNITTALRYRF